MKPKFLPTSDRSPTKPLAGRRVLLAEGGRPPRALYVDAFEQAGASVVSVGDGRAALRESQTADKAGRPFDLAVLDDAMPVLGGADVALALRMTRFSGVIVGLTGGVEPAEARRWRECGCAFILPKALPPKLLVARIAAAADRRAAATIS